MAEELTNSEISLLCDIGTFDPLEATADHRKDLERLVSGGYVEATDHFPPGAGFKLTMKGVEYLGQRGAGLNEA